MKEPYQVQQQILKLQIFYDNGKTYLKGWSLHSFGVSIPYEKRNNLFEYSKEEIDELVENFMESCPDIYIEKEKVNLKKSIR